MKKFLLVLILVPFLMCSSCDTECSKSNNVSNGYVNMVFKCNVKLPTSKELDASYGWIDNLRLNNIGSFNKTEQAYEWTVNDSSGDSTSDFVYFCVCYGDGTTDATIDLVHPFNATIEYNTSDLTADGREGIVYLNAKTEDKGFFCKNGKTFFLEFYNKTRKRNIVNSDYIVYDGVVKGGTNINLDVTLDGIYVNTEVDLPIPN